MRTFVAVAASVVLLAGCADGGAEARGRAIAEKVKESIPDVVARALEQKVTPEQVKRAQQGLQTAHEYLGEVNGELDAVTVNAVMAFQRAHDLKDDGILNDKTQRALEQVAAK